ncbi:MAG: undecaprenyldiphospho-muramoylpentapeptide beta-N-acetylglucosaminyltransferase [bacterium]
MKRYIVAGGGTGGHIYPALRIGRVLQDGGAQIVFAGTRRGMETQIVPQRGIELLTTAVRSLQRDRPWTIPLFSASLLISCLQSLIALRRLRPRGVIGTGGYASVPWVMMASLMGIPTLIFEADVHAGIANRLLGRFADRICLGYEEAKKFFPPGKVVVTGNPIDPDFIGMSREEARSRMGIPQNTHVVLFVGGSQGAQRINEPLVSALPELLKRKNLVIVHAAGGRNYESVREKVERFVGERYLLLPYIDDMASALNAADLVVSRTGATTLAEISACGLPSILIPYPFATANHQERNARELERRGACVVIPDAELTPERLISEITRLLDDPRRLEDMSERIRGLGDRGRAAQTIAELIEEVAEKRSAGV